MTSLLEGDPTTTPPPTEPAADGGRSRPLASVIVAMLIVAAVLTVVIVAVSANSKDAAAPKSYEVTADTGAAQEVRDGTDLVPSIIRLEPGQRIVLRNGDFQPHTLGELTAGRGETVAQTYATEGRFLLTTSLRPEGRVTVLVQKR